MKTYSRQQLALRNGQDREEIWVAYDGYIYDVTDSRLWKDGKHYEHWSGQELTRELEEEGIDSGFMELIEEDSSLNIPFGDRQLYEGVYTVFNLSWKLVRRVPRKKSPR